MSGVDILRTIENERTEGPGGKRKKKNKRKPLTAVRSCIKIPLRDDSKQAELNIITEDLDLARDRTFATSLTSIGSEANFFYRLNTPNDFFQWSVFKAAMMKPYVAKIEENINVYLIKNFVRSDQLESMDIVTQNINIFLGSIRTFQDFTECMEFLAISPILNSYYWNRRQKSIGLSGKYLWMDSRCNLLISSYRKPIALEWISQRIMWPYTLSISASEVSESIKKRLVVINYKCDIKAIRVREFKRKNEAWWKHRIIGSGFKPIQMSLDTATARRALVDRKSELFAISLQQFVNEWNQFPPAFGYMYHFCRVKKDCTFQVTSNSMKDIVQVVTDKGKRPVNLAPSTLRFSADAINILESNKEGYHLKNMDPPKRAPSLCSMSGFSTDSHPSTATITPKNWLYDWKMQAMHEQFDHRCMTIRPPNEGRTKLAGDLEQTSFINQEIDGRLNYLQNFITKASQYREILAEGEEANVLVGASTRTIGNIDHTNKRLNSIAKLAVNCEEEMIGIIHKSYIESSRFFSKRNTSYNGLDISSAWKIALDSGMIPNNQKLSSIVNARDSWVNSSAFCDDDTIPLCYKQVIQTTRKKTRFPRVLIIDLLLIIVALIIIVTLVVQILSLFLKK